MHPSDPPPAGPDRRELSARSSAPPHGYDLLDVEPPPLIDRLRLGIGDGRLVQLLSGALVVIAVGVVAWVVLRPEAPATDDLVPVADPPPMVAVTLAAGTAASTTAPPQVLVHAAGAVTSPGLYELATGSRVADLVDAAGGATADADLDRVNLAQPLQDGTRVFVPLLGQDIPPAVAVGSSDAVGSGTTVPGPVDLNAATAEQLDDLPGVGPATAQAILDHRATNGPFGSVDELLDVRGIGEAKLAELRPLVAVG